jgi:predicted PurR-regulated permease PerM
MAEAKKVVKGGFRATLAIIISIIALIVSIAAYNATSREDKLTEGIKTLEQNLDSFKKDSMSQIDKLRNDTADMLEKLKEVVQKNSQQ